jgi:excisionase family DNA binding protein
VSKDNDVPIWHRAMLTVGEVAAICGVSVSTANRWTLDGGLPTVPHMTEKRIARQVLDEWLTANPEQMQAVA